MTGIILVHGKALNTLLLNMQTWNTWCNQYEFICPSDDPLNGFDNVYCKGASQHNGHDSVERMRYACERASKYKNACILEYDTMLFHSPPKPSKNQIYGCGPFYDDNIRFKSKWWSHSPWLTSMNNFKKLSVCQTDELETHFPDRWISAAADYVGLTPVSYKSWFSVNSIDTPQYEKEAITARHINSAIAIHGVKTADIYNKLK